MENISKYKELKETHTIQPVNHLQNTQNELTPANPQSAKFDESSELLSRALKRKFTELDEITRRLRLRLSNVTNDESDASNDELADEFERDINTLCVEDDYDMINLQTETDEYNVRPDIGIGLLQLQGKEGSEKKCEVKTDHDPLTINVSENASNVSLSERLNADTANSMGSLDKHLVQGKQHIDTLLQKLSLLSAPENNSSFQNRYVSGCSVNQESDKAADILKELGIDSDPQLNTEALFNPKMFQQIYAASSSESSPILGSSSSSTTLKSMGLGSSDCSLLGKTPDQRMAPDGEGNSVDDKTVQNKTP